MKSNVFGLAAVVSVREERNSMGSPRTNLILGPSREASMKACACLRRSPYTVRSSIRVARHVRIRRGSEFVLFVVPEEKEGQVGWRRVRGGAKQEGS
jgi:hypothetical protein